MDLPLLLRGAKLARDEKSFRRSNELSTIERDALDKEANPKFSEQSKELKIILLTCCIGAIVQGWTQASIIGANLQWPHVLNVPDTSWRFGIVNAITYFSASFAGSWLSDPFNEYFTGRRGALFVAGVFTLVGSVGSAFTNSWQALLACRLVLGIGYGAKASVVPIFESEVAPPRIRGRLLVSWQTFTAVGILLSSAVNLLFHGPRDSDKDCPLDMNSTMDGDNWRCNVAWRLQIGSCLLPAIPLLVLAFVCSE